MFPKNTTAHLTRKVTWVSVPGMGKSMNIRDVDEQLRRLFRALCMERGETLRAGIIRLMREELQKAGKIPVEKP